MATPMDGARGFKEAFCMCEASFERVLLSGEARKTSPCDVPPDIRKTGGTEKAENPIPPRRAVQIKINKEQQGIKKQDMAKINSRSSKTKTDKQRRRVVLRTQERHKIFGSRTNQGRIR